MRSGEYELIEHTADVGLVACGESLAEAFAATARGMFEIIAGLDAVRETESRTMEVVEDGYEALLFEWLNGLLYRFDVEAFLPRRCEIVSLERNYLKSVCYGERYDPARHRLKTGVKAATYHMLEADEERKRVRVIFDV